MNKWGLLLMLLVLQGCQTTGMPGRSDKNECVEAADCMLVSFDANGCPTLGRAEADSITLEAGSSGSILASAESGGEAFLIFKAPPCPDPHARDDRASCSAAERGMSRTPLRGGAHFVELNEKLTTAETAEPGTYPFMVVNLSNAKCPVLDPKLIIRPPS